MLICGSNGDCVLKNDRFTPFAGALNVTKFELATGAETVLFSQPALALPAGPGAAMWFNVGASIDATAFVLRGVVVGADGALVTDAFSPLLPPANWTSLPLATVGASVADEPNADGSIDVTVTADKPAAFVTLTTAAAGRFSDNALPLVAAGSRVLRFEPWGDAAGAADQLRATLRVDHLAAAMQGVRDDAARAARNV